MVDFLNAGKARVFGEKRSREQSDNERTRHLAVSLLNIDYFLTNSCKGQHPEHAALCRSATKRRGNLEKQYDATLNEHKHRLRTDILDGGQKIFSQISSGIGHERALLEYYVHSDGITVIAIGTESQFFDCNHSHRRVLIAGADSPGHRGTHTRAENRVTIVILLGDYLVFYFPSNSESGYETRALNS